MFGTNDEILTSQTSFGENDEIIPNMQEHSIAAAKGLSIDEIMDDAFDMEKHIGAESAAQLDTISNVIPKQELLSDLQIDSMLKTSGADDESLEARRMALMAVMNENTSQGTLASIKEGWKNNNIQIQIADIRLEQMRGNLDTVQANEMVRNLKLSLKETKAKGFNSFIKSAASMVPMGLEISASGAKYGLIAGATGAGAALVAGVAGPQAVLPEEGVTVPGTALTMGSIGFQYGSAKRASEIEAGLMMDELMEMKDENGNGIDPYIANHIAQTVGLVNGMLELFQIKDIIKTIPGGKQLLERAKRKTIQNVVRNQSLKKAVFGGLKRWTGHIGTETLTEDLQESNNIIFGELAKNINNEMQGTGFAPAAIEDITNRIVDTTIESAKAFAVISGPGNVIQTTQEAVQAAAKTPTSHADAKTGQKEGVTGPAGLAQQDRQGERISRIGPSEAIKVRVDVDSLGKVMVDIPMEMPEKKKATRNESLQVEEDIDPEDAKLYAQAESEMEAMEAFQTIKPKLYIGNVTARMKRDMAAGTLVNPETGEAYKEWEAVDPEQIQGFHEGAWPTKRTQVEMTMDEGRALLIQMENSLQERVDKGQLNTDSDLARANADWGDIAALRKELGLPKGLRPFRVIREAGTKTILIENTRERIQKTTQAGALDVVETTEIKRLGDVMKRVAKYAKEGFAAGKKEVRQAIALARYLKKQAQLRAALIKKITKRPSDKMDFFYREAIESLQNAIDWGVKTVGKKQEKESLRETINRNPELAQEIDPKILETLSKKDVADLSYNDLLTVNNEIQRLRQLGLLKSREYRLQRAQALEREKAAFIENIRQAHKPVDIITKIQTDVLKPTRIFDLLDGGKKFSGRIFKFFYEQTNEDYNAELQNTDVRLESGKRRMAELGLSIKDLASKRVIGDITFTVDEMMSIWNGWKNLGHRLALQYGGWELKHGKKDVLITDELYKKIDAALTDREKLACEFIIQENSEHYDRNRNAVIAAENRDMGHEANYTHMQRARKNYTSTEQEILDDLAYRHFIRQISPAKGYTIRRKDIPAMYQTPLKGGAFETWFGQVRKQEHYINNALHIKDMQAMLRKSEFIEAIREKFGDAMIDNIKDYVARIANPDFYKNYGDMEKMSRILRKNAAIAYISWNLSSVMNQIPAIMSYWVNSSVMDIIQSATEAAIHPMQAFERAKAIHYQISHNSIEREMIELEKADQNAYQKIINTIGRAGMYGLFAMDRAVRVVGINAVYNAQIRNGASIAEAKQKAVMTTLLTQEAAAPKDLARIYSSNEFLNWFLMFTNQLNQLYNITTYDIPTAYRNKNYREAGRSAISLATMAMMIWMIQNGRLPEDEDDAIEALWDEFLGMLPLIGGWINAGRKGWDTQLPLQTLVVDTTKGVNKIMEGDLDKAVEILAEPLALMTAFPYQGVKEAYQFIEEAD